MQNYSYNAKKNNIKIKGKKRVTINVKCKMSNVKWKSGKEQLWIRNYEEQWWVKSGKINVKCKMSNVKWKSGKEQLWIRNYEEQWRVKSGKINVKCKMSNVKWKSGEEQLWIMNYELWIMNWRARRRAGKSM